MNCLRAGPAGDRAESEAERFEREALAELQALLRQATGEG